MARTAHKRPPLLGVFSALAVWLMVSPGLAQETTAVARAREQFRIGFEHAETGNWEEAEAAFRRAYSDYPNPTILFNLAGARVQLGRLVEARESYREFVRRAGGDNSPQVQTARRQIVELSEKIGAIEIHIQGFVAGDILLVDDRDIDRVDRLEVDPGPHVLAVRRGTAVVARTRVDVPEGETVEARLAIVSLADRPGESGGPEGASAGLTDDEDDDDTLLIGVLTTVAALAVAGGVTTAVVVATSGDDGFSGSLSPGVVTVAFR